MSSEVLSMRRGGVVARVLRDNGLSLTLLTLFVAFFIGQTITGQHHYNDERVDHGKSVVTLSEYIRTGDFLEATAENWESEFLQMAAYVLFTAFLFQRGSSESKQIGVQEAVDRDPALVKYRDDMPWPVRHGGWILKLYSYSLSIALFTLFLASLGLHGIGGAAAYNEEQLSHGGQAVSVLGYMATSQFWFESFQNWQSEFLSIAVMVIFSIFLRHRGSPESKPVDASHEATGTG